MKKLAFGLMRLPQTDPNDWTAVDLKKTREMIDRYLAAGFTYFDTAYVYHGGSSEKAFRTETPEKSFHETVGLYRHCFGSDSCVAGIHIYI